MTEHENFTLVLLTGRSNLAGRFPPVWVYNISDSWQRLESKQNDRVSCAAGLDGLKGLSHEIDYKIFDKNLQN